jgi:aspartyl-tRNA(Asn)/glutamyl-tRNA(Gln) amidotransferase subunit A
MKTQQKLKQYLAKIRKENKKLNIFLELRNEKELIQEAKAIDAKITKGNAGKLAGKVIAAKANINVRGTRASCGSNTLKDYKATYDATVIDKIRKEDGLIIGIVNCDEFACGSSGETSAFGACANPSAKGLIPGGSSSGSAAAVAADFADMALGSDTGGSIRNPASHCGVVGIKPTYSSVSRYGLIDLAMSFDQISPIASNVEDAALLLSVIQGKDEKDAISQNPPQSLAISKFNIGKVLKGITIGVLDLKAMGIKVDLKISELIEVKTQEVAKKYGWKIKKIKLPYLDLAIETYYPIVYVEFFSGTRKFDGRRYGKKIEEACGSEVLRRILGGSEISKAEFAGRYYHKALKVRKLIQEEVSKVFTGKNNVDVLIMPTVPKLPHRIGEKISVEEMYAYDALTIPANLAGNCAMSVPCGKINNIPIGLQVMADKFEEEKMLRVAKGVESLEIN